jgi:hypothetical protein
MSLGNWIWSGFRITSNGLDFLEDFRSCLLTEMVLRKLPTKFGVLYHCTLFQTQITSDVLTASCCIAVFSSIEPLLHKMERTDILGECFVYEILKYRY